MNQTQQYALSTVAVAAYNCICKERRAFTEEQLATVLEGYLPGYDSAQVPVAVRALYERGMVEAGDQGWAPVDQKRRPVVRRDLTTVRVDEAGVPRGGWTGWMVRDALTGYAPVPDPERGFMQSVEGFDFELLDKTERAFSEAEESTR